MPVAHHGKKKKKPVDSRPKLQRGAIGFLEIVIDFSVDLRLLRPMEGYHVAHTVLCKSNANEIRDISRFVLAIFRRYLRDISLGLPSHETDNSAISKRHLAEISFWRKFATTIFRLVSNEISLQRNIVETIFRREKWSSFCDFCIVHASLRSNALPEGHVYTKHNNGSFSKTK